MLKARPHQPRPLRTLNQRAASHSDILGRPAIQAMVRSPAPHVLDIRARRTRDMQHRKRSFAINGVSVAAVGIDERVRGAADADARVPEADVAGRRPGHVHLQDDGSLQHIGDGEN